MVRSLTGCKNCGFVTRKYSYTATGGRCPDCRNPLEEVTFREARALAYERHEKARRKTEAPVEVAEVRMAREAFLTGDSYRAR
jgi:predicted ATP-dependent serine protease